MIQLESVRRKTGGRIHLTPRVPANASKAGVQTLCGQELQAGSYEGVDGSADCSNCARRSHDAGRISSLFFQQDEGGELLRLSLQQARLKRPVKADSDAPQAPRPRLRVLPDRPSPPRPQQVGELATLHFKEAGEGVWKSPMGVLVKMRRQGDEWRFMELVYEGRALVTRTAAGLRIRAGDVAVNASGDGYEVRVIGPDSTSR